MATTMKEVAAKLVPLKVAKEIQVAQLGQALRHLHDLLPLKERQQSLEKPLVEVHRAILRSLVERGRPLTGDEIAGMLGSKGAAAQTVALLGSYDLVVRNELTVQDSKTGALVVLDAKGGDVVGAYPVTTETTPHKITVNGHDLYAMCAVDALAVGPMFNVETSIQSRCHVTGEPISIHQKGKEILGAKPSNNIQVGVRWQRLIDCCAHVMCRQMVFLKDPETAIAWQNMDPLSIELFTLEETIEFGGAFFLPLLTD
ncbi:MAG: alkylmercury lyase family protein [Gammaproteobacteria bacterium]|nr:alkylmercury lyase family protein [Gammaproteobacteria bacterium]